MAKNANKWVESTDRVFFTNKTELPHELKVIVGDNEAEYLTLADMGIECGQGLRTGANNFFYVSIEDAGAKLILFVAGPGIKAAKNIASTRMIFS